MANATPATEEEAPVKKTPTARIALTCCECGAKFGKAADLLHDVECPKCHGVDVEVG